MARSNVQHKDEVALSIQNLVNSQKEGQIRDRHAQPSITVVPNLYRDQNPSCFDPQVIAIGPLHRAHKNVQQHQGLKATYLHHLLARSKSQQPTDHIFNACLTKVRESIEKIKGYYEEDVMKYKDDSELAYMMVKDACFILEFLVKRSENKSSCPPGNRFVMNHIICDLLLLENQIPFFVLQDMFDCVRVSEFVEGASLIDILLTVVISTMRPFEGKEPQPRENPHTEGSSGSFYYNHILDVLHQAYRPAGTKPETRLLSIPVSHSALELNLAGVKFRPNHKGNWQMAIEYESYGFLCSHRPTLLMPVMYIHDKTELILRNLIAYEQSSPNNGYQFTSYACAMDMLVDNKDDVMKLVESKVIINKLGSNESAANLINNIFYGLYYEEFSYQSQWEKLDEYCNFYWPRNTARLRQAYFNSPWNMIALVAVILLFLLSVIQTTFTVIG